MYVLCQPLSHRTHSFDKERAIRMCCLALVQTESVSVVAVISGYRAARYFTEKGHNQMAKCCRIMPAPLATGTCLLIQNDFFSKSELCPG